MVEITTTTEVETLSVGAIAVAKKKDSAQPRDDVAVKIDRALWRLAGAVAAFRGLSLAEYLSAALKPIVTREFDDLPKERKAEGETKTR